MADQTALERLNSDDCPLFTLVIGHLMMLALWLGSLALVELAHRIFGPFSWWVYFPLNAAGAIALLFLTHTTCSRAVNGLLDLAHARMKTPDRLQRGCRWLREKTGRVQGILVVSITLILIFSMTPSSGSADVADSEFFKSVLLFWVCVYGLFITLLVLGSWVAGRFLGTPDIKAG